MHGGEDRFVGFPDTLLDFEYLNSDLGIRAQPSILHTPKGDHRRESEKLF